MRCRRKRTEPSFTELARVKQVLERDLALRERLGPKSMPVKKRDTTVVLFSAETVAVARELMARKLNPERAYVGQVLVVAVDVLRIGRSPASRPPSGLPE